MLHRLPNGQVGRSLIDGRCGRHVEPQTPMYIEKMMSRWIWGYPGFETKPRYYMSKGQKMVCTDLVFGRHHFQKSVISCGER